jgi:hypothetical protein
MDHTHQPPGSGPSSAEERRKKRKTERDRKRKSRVWWYEKPDRAEAYRHKGRLQKQRERAKHPRIAYVQKSIDAFLRRLKRALRTPERYEWALLYEWFGAWVQLRGWRDVYRAYAYHERGDVERLKKLLKAHRRFVRLLNRLDRLKLRWRIQAAREAGHQEAVEQLTLALKGLESRMREEELRWRIAAAGEAGNQEVVDELSRELKLVEAESLRIHGELISRQLRCNYLIPL